MARRGSSTSFPLCVVAMELASQLEARQTRLSLEWSPREVNQQADDLTNEKFDEFDLDRRLEIDFERLPWKYLPQAMREGAEFYGQTAKLHEQRRGLPRSAAGKKIDASVMRRAKASSPKVLSLRMREPW